MKRIRRLAFRQKGTVLITVMLMVAVAALIATDIAYRQQMDVLRTGAFLARDAAAQYLMAAEELGLYALHADRKEDDRKFKQNANEPIQDNLGEEWNKGGIFPLPDGIGTVEGRLYDLQGRFNVNSLKDSDPKRQAIYANVFTAILNDLLSSHPQAFPQNTTANMLKERVIDWLDPDQQTSGLDGMEDDDYFRKERPYRTANHAISDISELLLIEGFTPRALDLLADKVSFLPLSAKINLYTASKDLLIKLGFSEREASDFHDNQRPTKFKDRATTTYKDVNELFTYLMGTNAGNPADPANPAPADPLNPATPGAPVASGLQIDMFDIRSDFYLLKGKAVVNGKPVLVESVVWKPPLPDTAAEGSGGAANTNPNPPVKTILRKFVDPLKQTNQI